MERASGWLLRFYDRRQPDCAILLQWTVGDIPADIGDLRPNPTTWGNPAGAWAAASCDPYRYFREHSLVINLSICGDWAGGAYANSGCGGDCASQVMDPAHFQTARFRIRSVRTYTADGLSEQIHALGGVSGTGAKTSAAVLERLGGQWLPLVLLLLLCLSGLA